MKFNFKKFREEAQKPCKTLNYCPYGSLVEQFPLPSDGTRCGIFGHQCPVFSVAEPMTEDDLDAVADMICKGDS